MKFQSVVLLLAVLLASATAADYQPIKDVNDPHVVDIASYAVREHDDKTGLKLKLEKVISGEYLILIEGRKYCLNITATDTTASNKYNVVVFDIPVQGYRNLTSFVPLSD
jgi:cystatin-C